MEKKWQLRIIGILGLLVGFILIAIGMMGY